MSFKFSEIFRDFHRISKISLNSLKFTQENAELLMKNSADFDTWVTEVVGDLENFTESKSI